MPEHNAKLRHNSTQTTERGTHWTKALTSFTMAQPPGRLLASACRSAASVGLYLAIRRLGIENRTLIPSRLTGHSAGSFSSISVMKHASCQIAVVIGCFALLSHVESLADEPVVNAPNQLLISPDLFAPLTEPPCSYCSTQHRKGLIEDGDRVIAWIRGAHNGGAIPLRHFLAGPRVVNDTYGLFFYDPDGGYVAAYKKDYGYSFYGWRNGVMIVKGPDGSLWSAVTGICFEGPKKGQQLVRVSSMVTNWDYWLMLHPESTAYDLFDGKKYAVTALPQGISKEAKQTMGSVDGRLPPMTSVMGVEVGDSRKAFALNESQERACFNDTINEQPVAVFWYQPTKSAVAFSRNVDGQLLTFYADKVSPETAPIKDRETGTRWTLAGRAVDGPLRGKELQWVNSIQCFWYAWSAENPETLVYEQPSK